MQFTELKAELPPGITLPAHYDSLHQIERSMVRMVYVSEQKGLCYHCDSSLAEKPPKFILRRRVQKNIYPENFFNNPVHLHHDHGTGLTIGAVHAYCNAVLWEYYGE